MKNSIFLIALVAAGLSSVPALGDAPLVSATGTVVSIEGEVLIVKTDTGNLTFDLDKTTEMPAENIAVNSRITVWYDSDDDPVDRMDARRIEMAPAMTPPTPPARSEERTDTETRMEFSDTDDQREELPRTASPLALLAGSGLLALGGGAWLRARFRR